MPAKKPATVETSQEPSPAASTGEPKVRRPRTPLPEGFGAVAPTMLSFADAPPSVTRGRGASNQWGAVVEQLKANPGKWAVLGVYTSAGNRPAPLKEAGIEMRTVRVKNGDGGFAEGPNGEAMYELYGSYSPQG